MTKATPPAEHLDSSRREIVAAGGVIKPVLYYYF
jgi:hypothetical protein